MATRYAPHTALMLKTLKDVERPHRPALDGRTMRRHDLCQSRPDRVVLRFSVVLLA